MAASRTARILVADDEPDLLSLIQVLLEDEGYVVDVATDGNQALDLARTLKPDLIVMDAHMPELDGWTVLSELRRLGGAPPTIVLSGGVADPDRAQREGAFRYMCKPFHFDELISVCEQALEQ